MPAKDSAKPANTNLNNGEKKKKRRRGKPSYAIYIKRVLKQVHPDIGLHLSIPRPRNVDIPYK